MIITDYKFGAMTINGNIYRRDLIILPNEIISKWWRKEGHLLQKEDLENYLDILPQLLIVGTGKFGLMKVDPPFIDWLKNHKIKLQIEKTDEAVRKYNELTNKLNAIAAFHLTC